MSLAFAVLSLGLLHGTMYYYTGSFSLTASLIDSLVQDSTVDPVARPARPDEFPVIDFSVLHNAEASEAELEALAVQVRHACAHAGFFYVKGHGMKKQLSEQILKDVDSFFALPTSVKAPLGIKNDGFTRGYVGIGGESGSNRLEVKEAFSWGYSGFDDGVKQPVNALQGPNIWPNDPSLRTGWQDGMTEFYDSMIEVAELVLQGLSLSLDLPRDELAKDCTEGNTISLMRAFHYFPYNTIKDATATRIGSSPHTDWGFITLIMQDEVAGVEAFINEEWVTLPTISDTILVNCGDYLSLVTRGRYFSPLHRVMTKDVERTSLVLFYYPNYDATLSTPEATGDDMKRQDYSLLTNQHEDGNEATLDISQVKFGDYIANKWSQVFRKNAK